MLLAIFFNRIPILARDSMGARTDFVRLGALWTALTIEEYEAMRAHVRGNDFPETTSQWYSGTTERRVVVVSCFATRELGLERLSMSSSSACPGSLRAEPLEALGSNFFLKDFIARVLRIQATGQFLGAVEALFLAGFAFAGSCQLTLILEALVVLYPRANL